MKYCGSKERAYYILSAVEHKHLSIMELVNDNIERREHDGYEDIDPSDEFATVKVTVGRLVKRKKCNYGKRKGTSLTTISIRQEGRWYLRHLKEKFSNKSPIY